MMWWRPYATKGLRDRIGDRSIPRDIPPGAVLVHDGKTWMQDRRDP
jgi:hypothetical protein